MGEEVIELRNIYRKPTRKGELLTLRHRLESASGVDLPEYLSRDSALLKDKYSKSELYRSEIIVNNLPFTTLFTGKDIQGLPVDRLKKGQGLWRSFYPNNKLWCELRMAEGEFHGEVVYYYPNGRIHLQGQHRSGKKTGGWKVFYPSGQAWVEWNFFNDTIKGPIKSYDQQGRLTMEGIMASALPGWTPDGSKTESTFLNGIPYSHLKKTGTWNYYYPNGRLKQSIQFKNDVEFDLLETYDRKGNPLESGDLEQGNGTVVYRDNLERPIRELSFYRGKLDGAIKEYSSKGLTSVMHYEKGKKEGNYAIYADNGKLRESGQFKDDHLIGLRKLYDHKGIIRLELLYDREGIMQGIGRRYYDNGNLAEEVDYKAKLPSGTYRSFYRDGQLLEEGEYEKGLEHGVWWDYYPNGKNHTMTTYQHGSKHGSYQAFYENGRKQAEGSWLNDIDREGGWKFYYENGNLEKQGSYESTLPAGIWKYYHSSGKLKREGQLILVDQDLTYNLRSNIGRPLKKSVAHGPWTYHDKEGKLLYKLDFLEGVPWEGRVIRKNGDFTIQTEFFSGKPLPTQYYKDNKAFSGKYEEKSLSGEILEKGLCVDGLREGTWIVYELKDDGSWPEKGHERIFKAGQEVKEEKTP